MLRSSHLKGIFSALWLPIDKQGNMNTVSLSQSIEFQRSAGIQGILALGSTARFPMFSVSQREEIMEAVLSLASGLPVVGNISDVSERNVIRLGKTARKLGIPAVSIMAPMFYPLSQDDLLAYFLKVAEETELPMLLYNFPERSGLKIELSTIENFAQRAELVGVKQSGVDFLYHHDLVKLGREHDFAVLSGSDTQLPAAAELGAQGCVGGLSNIVPELLVQTYTQHWLKESTERDEVSSADKLNQVGRILDRLEFPLNVAAGIEARGFCPGARHRTVSAKSEKIYRDIVTELRALLVAWKLPTGASAV